MIKGEAIILCGGLGTRLSSAIPDIPKVLAPVAGLPFFDYLLLHLYHQGIRRFILASGYKHEALESYVMALYRNKRLPEAEFIFSKEKEPLGTGGAILHAMEKSSGDDILVVNGDSLFKVNLDQLLKFHTINRADCTLALKPMKNFERYGAVELNEAGRIVGFSEKKHIAAGLINGGTYVINKVAFREPVFLGAFSFEKNYLEVYLEKQMIVGLVADEYFIDIGVPEDLRKASKELVADQKTS